MNEIWKPVHGWEEYLEVSNLARVRVLARVATGIRAGKPIKQTRPMKVISPWVGSHGYKTVSISIGTVRKKLLLHRLVARAFVDGYADGLSVNHINGDKQDNRPENLEWVSLARNTQHQWETGLVDLRGDNAPGAKLNSAKVRIIRHLLSIGANCNELAVLTDVSPSTVYLIRDGARWSSVV